MPVHIEHMNTQRRWPLGLCLSILCICPAIAQPASRSAESSDTLARKLAAVPAETLLADGNLRIVNLYKLQAEIVSESQGRPAAEMMDRLVREVYLPFSSFWKGYLGDEAAFRKWVSTSLLETKHPIHTRLPAVLNLQLDTLFIQATKWLVQVSGKQPRGTWYIVFGPGWTNMGGLGEIGMVLDFTRQEPKRDEIEFVLPHELTHQIHETRREDPDRGTVVERIVSEGLASYAAYVYTARSQTPAQAIGYSHEDWQWAVTHEKELIAEARPYLDSKQRKDADLLAARNQRLLKAGPSAAGYFLGFRIMECYVEQRGVDAWTEALGIPVRDVLLRSGYPLVVPSASQ